MNAHEPTPSADPTAGARYCAGIVNHGGYPDLLRCLQSLERQTVPPELVVVADHDPDPRQLEAARKAHPDAVWEPGPNRGFAGGANRVAALSARLRPDAGFLLLLNADVQLDRAYAQLLIREMRARPNVALAAGKLLRRDRRTLDSAGISMGRTRRSGDRGSDQVDVGQYDRIEPVFAVSGAAMMLRRSAAEDLEVGGELFDEDFFAYHEDTDLAWRARLLGWSSLYVPSARGMHRRGWSASSGLSVDAAIRRHSFKNRYLEMIKNETGARFLRDLPAIAAWEGVRLGYALLWDRARVGAYADACRLAGRAWRKRREIQGRARRRAQLRRERTS